MMIEIKPAHPSFCVWDLYLDDEFMGQYDTYRTAENAAQLFEEAK